MIPKLRIMRRQTTHITRRAQRHRLAHGLLAAAVLAALALAPATAGAAEGRPPEIVSTGSGVGGEVTVSAQINPEGLETSYEIKLVCSLCGPAGYSPAVGTLSAVNEARTVTLNLTGIQPGTYNFEVLAHNADGNTSHSGELDVPSTPPGACPDGCSKNEENTAEIPPWSTALSNSESAQTLREYEARQRQLAKEQEEAKAREAARYASEEAELKQAEEHEAQEAAAREEAEHPACIVPNVKGETLNNARRALAKAHCRLGAVHRFSDRHLGALNVSAQSAPAGKRLAQGARVALWCRAKQAPHGGGRGR
jgi:DNA polymerase III gamma/tau subunit